MLLFSYQARCFCTFTIDFFSYIQLASRFPLVGEKIEVAAQWQSPRNPAKHNRDQGFIVISCVQHTKTFHEGLDEDVAMQR